MTGIDESAIASVLGVSVAYVGMLTGGARSLPQRIAVVAQGESAVSYSAAKWPATSAGAAGAKYGFRSPIYKIMQQLLPANGDGVGTIPIDIFPLEDDASGAVATGTVTPSGTATKASSARLRVSGVLTKPFVIPAGAVVLNNLLRVIGEACTETIDLPVTVGYTYGAVTASAITGTGNGTLTAPAVHTGRLPKPGAWTLTNTAAVVNGGVWSLTDPDGDVVVTGITQTVGVGAVSAFTDKAGLDFTLTDGTTDFGVGATFTLTVPATNLKLVSAWKGESANDLVIEFIGDTTLGVTFAIVQPTGGLVNPDVTSALNAFGTVWETLVINGLNIEDTTALDAYQAAGEARWDPVVMRPFVVFTGNTKVTLEDATAICQDREGDRVNSQLPAPGCVNLPCAVAAREAGLIARQANNDPATSYQTQQATGLIPGDDAVQWDPRTRDLAVNLGSSTVKVADDVVRISDVVTFYRPTGEQPPGFRKVVTIVKLQNCIFNTAIEFEKAKWAAAPVIADSDASRNENAKKPRDFKAEMNSILENLGDAALIKNVDVAKQQTTAKINEQNTDRVDVKAVFPMSSNADIINVELDFGFAA